MDDIEDLKYTRLLQQTPHVLLHGIVTACVKGVGKAISQLFKSHEQMIHPQDTALFPVQFCVFLL